MKVISKNKWLQKMLYWKFFAAGTIEEISNLTQQNLKLNMT